MESFISINKCDHEKNKRGCKQKEYWENENTKQKDGGEDTAKEKGEEEEV